MHRHGLLEGDGVLGAELGEHGEEVAHHDRQEVPLGHPQALVSGILHGVYALLKQLLLGCLWRFKDLFVEVEGDHTEGNQFKGAQKRYNPGTT